LEFRKPHRRRLAYGGQSGGLADEPVRVNVNETEYACMTNGSGYFNLSLNFKALNNNATTYTIAASFEDNSTVPINAIAWATTLDGHQYPACTTIQYGHEPRSFGSVIRERGFEINE
jgi:hypothetical protein